MVTGEDFLHRFFPLFYSPSFSSLISSRGHLKWGQNLWSPHGSFPWVGSIQGEAEDSARLCRKGRLSSPKRATRITGGHFDSLSTFYSSLLLVAWTFSVKFFRNCTLILVFHPLFPSLTLVPFSLASLTMALISPSCVWPTKFNKSRLLQCGWEESADQLPCGYTM